MLENSDDILAQFEATFAANAVPERRSNENNAYRTFELCWSQGQVIGKFLPDANKIPFRVINNLTAGSYDGVNDEGKAVKKYFKLAPITEFAVELTPSQIALYNEVLLLLGDYRKITEGNNNIKDIPRYTIFYMIIKKYIDLDNHPTEYAGSRVSIAMHRSYNFTTKFKEACTGRTNIYGKEWYADFFSRKVGECNSLFMIGTKRPTAGYEMTFDFIQNVPSNKLVITQEMLDQAKNLEEEIFDRTYFNEELYARIRDELKAACADPGVSITPHNPQAPQNPQ